MGVSPDIVEKDFWVCWSLRRLFELSDMPGLIFKGGTSLSKAYGVIQRFSEDIDISFDRRDLGFGDDRDPEAAASKRKQKDLIKELDEIANELVQTTLLDRLHETMSTALGDPVKLTLDPDNAQTLHFVFPRAEPGRSPLAYVQPRVALEFGARSDHLPAETRTITAYAHQMFPDLMAAPDVEVKTLGAERTFWEKATILHMLHHQDAERPLGDRMSRHYSDLVELSLTETKTKALSDLGLLRRVASHKAVYFRSAWAKYETAHPPHLKLLPGDALKDALRRDYAQMPEMFFGKPRSFDEILTVIGGLQDEINALG